MKHWVSGANVYTRYGNDWVSGATYFFIIYNHTRHRNNYVSGATQFFVIFIAALDMEITGEFLFVIFKAQADHNKSLGVMCDISS